MRVFILTEGGKKTGFGHITRCSAIYDAFREKKIMPFFLIKADSSISGILEGRNYKIFDWLKEQNRLFTIIRDADVVVIDSYLAKYELYKKVSEIIRMPVYIDDNKRLKYSRGVVVNGSIFANRLGYPKAEGITYLLGTNYMPLRREFWHVQAKKIAKNVKSVVVTFGGGDSRGMTPKILRWLADNHPNLTKNIIIGKGFKNIRKIEDTKDDRTVISYYPDVKVMKRIMLDSDIAISAGGQTLYELARIGVPAIAMAIAKNQLNNISGWSRAGFIEYAGWWKDDSLVAKLSSSMTRLADKNVRTKMSRLGRRHIDGKGSLRIVSILLNRKGSYGRK